MKTHAIDRSFDSSPDAFSSSSPVIIIIIIIIISHHHQSSSSFPATLDRMTDASVDEREELLAPPSAPVTTTEDAHAMARVGAVAPTRPLSRVAGADARSPRPALADVLARELSRTTSRVRRNDDQQASGANASEGEDDEEDMDQEERARVRAALAGVERVVPLVFVFTCVFAWFYFLPLVIVFAFGVSCAKLDSFVVARASERELANASSAAFAAAIALMQFALACVVVPSASDSGKGMLWRRLVYAFPKARKGECSFVETVLECATCDYVAKSFVIAVKGAIVALPVDVLRVFVGGRRIQANAQGVMPNARVYRRRSAALSAVEYASLIGRCATPAPMWCGWFSRELTSAFAMIITGVYVVIKVRSVVARAEDFVDAAGTPWWKDAGVGESASSEEVIESGNQCAICQETCVEATKLTCTHIFCQDCIAEWFDRQSGAGVNNEKTCPVCRAVVQRGAPKSFGDGSTSLWPILF